MLGKSSSTLVDTPNSSNLRASPRDQQITPENNRTIEYLNTPPPPRFQINERKIQRKVRRHSPLRFAQKIFCLGFIALMPVYMPWLLVQFLASPVQESTPPKEMENITLPVNNTPPVVLNNFREVEGPVNKDGLSLRSIEKSLSSILKDKFKDSYQNRNEYMNMGSIKAGARIFNLNCPDFKPFTQSLLNKLLVGEIQYNQKCKNPVHLIEDGSSHGWTYYTQTAILYIEFGSRVRVHAVGLELSKPEFRNMIENRAYIQAVGINHFNGKDLWDDANDNRGRFTESVLYEIDLSDWSDKEDLGSQIRLYYDCKNKRCIDTYRGIKFNIITYEQTSETTHHSIDRIFVFDKF